jgi:hypothetical protein
MAVMDQKEFNRIFAKSNELWDTDFFQKHANAAAESLIEEVKSDFGCQLHSRMRHLDSPLEAAFLAWWMVVSHRCENDYGLCAQREVTAGGNRYRLDFTIEPILGGFLACLIDAPDCPRIAIELDGHDYHEKTKEQVTYRNRRDRDLQADGWIVLHVSGSEFNANPEAVTREIRNRASALLYAAYHRRRA